MKNCRIRNVPKPVINPGKAMPQYVSIQPKLLDIIYQGIISISVGIISVLRMAMKTIWRPRKSNLASV